MSAIGRGTLERDDLLEIYRGRCYILKQRKGVAMAFSKQHFDRVAALAREYGATRLILFGSAVDHPETARDLDFACDGVPGWKLYELAARLENELNVPLDLIPLQPPSRFTQHIERQGRELL